jgi:hypothetical protein
MVLYSPTEYGRRFRRNDCECQERRGCFREVFEQVFWLRDKEYTGQSFLSALVTPWSFEETNAPRSKMRKVAGRFFSGQSVDGAHCGMRAKR